MLPRGETSTSYIPEHPEDRSVEHWLRTNAVLASLFTLAIAAVLVFGGLRAGQRVLTAEGSTPSVVPAADLSALLVTVRSEDESWTEIDRGADDAALMRP